MTARDPLLTISGSPGLYHDPSRPEHGSIATLTLVPPVGVFTADDRPGAEQPVDVAVSAVLGHGFALVSALGVAELAALPAPAGGTARLDALTGTLRLDVGVLGYVGDVGSAPPAGWLAAARRRGQLVVVATGVNLASPTRGPACATRGCARNRDSVR